jgi:hypothetical protein
VNGREVERKEVEKGLERKGERVYSRERAVVSNK